MDREIRALTAASGDVVVVATVPTIEPYGDIREYATKLFENNGRGIGQKGKDNGLLILLAVKERRVWIEVGYGLEELDHRRIRGRNDPRGDDAGVSSGSLRTRTPRRDDADHWTHCAGAQYSAHGRRGSARLLAGARAQFPFRGSSSSSCSSSSSAEWVAVRARGVRRWGRGGWSGWSSGVGPFGGGWGGGGFGGGGGIRRRLWRVRRRTERRRRWWRWVVNI